ncbi:MAG: ABC transporter substrate-binding protein [Eubacteriales bacterium]
MKKKLLPFLLSLCLLASCSSDSVESSNPSDSSGSVSGQESNNNTQEDGSQEDGAQEEGTKGEEETTPDITVNYYPDRAMMDRMNLPFTTPESLDRIISTAPSNTEILIALGLGDKIAVVDVYSEGLVGLPDDVMVIDFQTPDIEALMTAECDIIIASEINMAGGEDPFAQMSEVGVPVAYLPTSISFADIYEDIFFLGELTGYGETAEVIIEDMKSRVIAVSSTVASAETKSVYFEISPAPYLFTVGAGTFLDDAITLAGGVNIYTEDGWISPTEEDILLLNPDIIITNATYMEDPVGEIMARENWGDITAVTEGQVYAVDNDQSSRPSHNAILALEAMAAAIHPDLFS